MVTVDELRAAFPVLDMVDLQRRPKTTVMGHDLAPLADPAALPPESRLLGGHNWLRT